MVGIDRATPELAGMAQLGLIFAELAATLRSQDCDSVDPDRLVRLAARSIPHADHCAVTVLRHNQRPRTMAATGPVPLTVDELQYAVGEGPCLDAATGDGLVLVRDHTDESRWPRFSPLCVAKTGVRAMLSVRLALSHEDRAAINFYALEPAAFGDVDVRIAAVLAPFAGLSVQSHVYRQEVAQLESALGTSRQIGAAVGILMSQGGLSYEQAFDQLRQASQDLNVKLRDVAAEVQWTGSLPTVEPRKDPHPSVD